MHGLESLENEEVARRGGFDAMGEGVRPSEEFARNVDHFQVEVGEVNQPLCLSAVERLGLAEISKIFMVGEDLHREGGTMKIVTPGFQGVNDGEKLAIVDIVISFGGGEGL